VSEPIQYLTRPFYQTELTTVWRDGEVLRRDWLGRTTVRPRTLAIEEPPKQFEPLEAVVEL
jgi:hypothetical protein